MLLLYIVSFKEFGSLVCLCHDVKLRKTQLEVRSLTATWSRDLWGHRVVVFFRNVSNCWLNSYGKFGGATRRRFFAICEKPYGGLKSTHINPSTHTLAPAGGGGPPVRGLNMLNIVMLFLKLNDNLRRLGPIPTSERIHPLS